jgi:hypothetical protein
LGGVWSQQACQYSLCKMLAASTVFIPDHFFRSRSITPPGSYKDATARSSTSPTGAQGIAAVRQQGKRSIELERIRQLVFSTDRSIVVFYQVLNSSTVRKTNIGSPLYRRHRQTQTVASERWWWWWWEWEEHYRHHRQQTVDKAVDALKRNLFARFHAPTAMATKNIKLAVGSKNPVKIKAVQDGFGNAFSAYMAEKGEGFEMTCEGIDVANTHIHTFTPSTLLHPY